MSAADGEETLKKGYGYPVMLSLVLLSPFLYLLALGPAFWMMQRVEFLEGPVAFMFEPLMWFVETEYGSFLLPIMEKYLEFWSN